MIFAFSTAFAAAVLHVISGPDHLAAVTPLAIETERKAWKIGLLWGVGHLSSMLLIGGLFYSFKEVIPLEAISAHSEQLVGIVLIGVGLWAFYQIFRKQNTIAHDHSHVDFKRKIGAQNIDETVNANEIRKKGYIPAFSIGMLHGLAGLSHFFLLLPVSSFSSTADSISYLTGFAGGTLVAMTFYALILSSFTKLTGGKSNPMVFRRIRFTGGLFAVVVGVYWSYLGFI